MATLSKQKQLLTGEAIRELRKGLTLRELAEKVGISAGHLSKIENGQVAPTIGLIEALCVSNGREQSYEEFLSACGVLEEYQADIERYTNPLQHFVDKCRHPTGPLTFKMPTLEDVNPRQPSSDELIKALLNATVREAYDILSERSDELNALADLWECSPREALQTIVSGRVLERFAGTIPNDLATS